MKKTFSIFALISFTALFISGGGGETSLQRGPQRIVPAQNNQIIKMDADYGKMPIYFIPNAGQMDKQVAYYVQGKDKTIYFTDKGITFALTKPNPKEERPSITGDTGPFRDLREDKPESREAALEGKKASPEPGVVRGPERDLGGASERWVIKLEFVGANKHVRPIGEAETGAVVSYFKGKPEEWHAGLPTYSKIVYPNLWPGIDLVYYGTVNRLKYEFNVHPGADPSRIRLAYRGAESVSVDGEGRLEVATPIGGFHDDVPVAYQEKDGRRLDIKLAYKVAGNSSQVEEVEIADRAALNDEVESEFPSAAKDRAISGPTRFDGEGRGFKKKIFSYGFRIGEYDHSLSLVLDPAVLVYCGYIGGSDSDLGYGITVDPLGNAYVTGHTWSTQSTFPVAVGPDLTYNGVPGYTDAFVAKVDVAGAALLYCGYIGGSSSDVGCGIAVDGAGNVYVTGWTSSTQSTFPVVVGPDLTYNSMAGGSADAFVAKVNAAGTGLIYCGYIGGSQSEGGYGIALDGSGNAYVTGETRSTEATFPVAVGPDLTYNDIAGYPDAFVAKVNAAGTALSYCGYIGGSDYDRGYGIALDGSGNAYVAGDTRSTDATFPAGMGPDLTFNDTFGSSDAFVAKVNAAGTALLYCGYIGGASSDTGRGIAVDGAGNAYVTGETWSTQSTFPVTVGPDLTFNDTFGSSDAFVAKISYWDVWAAKHAVGDFDGDGTAEVAVDFGSAGIWKYDSGTWIQLAPENPESLMAADIDGDSIDEILADLGSLGLWLWNAGAWNQISGVNVESMAAGDVDADGADEVVCDFGALGLWVYNGGAWTQLSGANADYVITADVDKAGAAEIAGDFGTLGLWIWKAGVWTQLSGVNPDYITSGELIGGRYLLCDFGASGFWAWTELGAWTHLSTANADYMITADTDADYPDDIFGDFDSLGLWLWDAAVWSQISGINAVYMIRADLNGDGKDDLVVDFGSVGLWLWTAGTWSQISGAIAEYLVAADLDGDASDEILADFGALGLWMWNYGVWSQMSANNPD
jgi:hypothetical protein